MNPTLIEPGARYFLSETLKKCNLKKRASDTFFMNLGLFALFFFSVVLYLAYKYKTKPTIRELENKKTVTRNYIVSTLRAVIQETEVKNKKMLTSLPKFESDYELLHEKFYNL